MSIKQLFFLTTMDEEEIEGVMECFPKLNERVRDWVVIAEESDQIVVHIIIENVQVVIDKLKGRPEYLGESYREIAQKAKADDATCKKVIKRIVFTTWEIDNPNYPEESLERINYKGSFGEWIDAGKPVRFTSWHPAHVWLGQSIETPNNDEVE